MNEYRADDENLIFDIVNEDLIIYFCENNKLILNKEQKEFLKEYLND